MVGAKARFRPDTRGSGASISVRTGVLAYLIAEIPDRESSGLSGQPFGLPRGDIFNEL